MVGGLSAFAVELTLDIPIDYCIIDQFADGYINSNKLATMKGCLSKAIQFHVRIPRLIIKTDSIHLAVISL